MSDLPRYLNQLEEELLALGEGAMMLELLDGFIAGLLICPELIPVRDWLGWIWDVEGGEVPVFDSHFEKVAGLVMRHYNATAKILFERPQLYGPLFAVDGRNDDILWELWIEGFEVAYKLRPSAWQKCLAGDAETAQAVSGLLQLIGVVQRDPTLSKEQSAALTAAAPDNIGNWVVVINEWRFAHEEPNKIPLAVFSSPNAKTGRNEPCPCGSGKKYKKCCAVN